MACEKCWGEEFPGCPNCEESKNNAATINHRKVFIEENNHDAGPDISITIHVKKCVCISKEVVIDEAERMIKRLEA